MDDSSSQDDLATSFAALLEQQAEMARQLFSQFSAAESSDKGGDWLNSAAQLQKLWLGHLHEQAAQLGDWQKVAGRDAPIWSEMAARLLPQDPRSDKRFADAAWRDEPFFNLLHQTYLMLGEQLSALADAAESVDPAQREQLRFALGVAVDALSPANFAATNPVALARAVETKGASLVKGMEHLIADLARGQLSHTDSQAFKVGENIAVTPGKVVHETPLYQLIHYAPTTDQVLASPLVIFPPWINRFYILDLNPAKSFVRWAVEQGISTFMVSWKSADESMADVVWDDYIAAQIEAVDVIRERLKVPSVHAIGYCVAGTTLAATLAIAGRRGDAERFKSATFLTAQVDFSEAGDLKHFIDDMQIGNIAKLAPRGYLDGRYMAASFNLLRSRELIWAPAIKHYLLGEDYPAFDLLHWNGDVTNLPAKWHEAYLRDLYRDNRLVEADALSGLGTPIDLHFIQTPCYIQAGREDHIAPPQSVWKLTEHLAGPWTFVLAGSGHIAGVVNPPSSGKYQHWTNPGEKGSLEAFTAGAKEHKGSWWPHWADWLHGQDAAQVPAKGKRVPGGKGDRVIEDAPGRYVRMR
jgi:polyhydroxyalkanoate synthase subunit PhaC